MVRPSLPLLGSGRFLISTSHDRHSSEAIAGLKGKETLNFVCIGGAHLMRPLTGDEGLVPILERVSRHADETGQAYLPVSQL